jgi:hypothetical protein
MFRNMTELLGWGKKSCSVYHHMIYINLLMNIAVPSRIRANDHSIQTADMKLCHHQDWQFDWFTFIVT